MVNKKNIHDFPLPCYSFIGKACENKLRGAVSLYMNQSCHFRERNNLSINFGDVIESTKRYNIIVGEIYKPPNDKLEQLKESLSELLKKIDLRQKKCYIIWDFNVDLLQTEESTQTSDVLNCTFSSSFYPLISRPTRITSRSAPPIDNIFVNSLEDKFSNGLLFTDLSDHLPIFQITPSLTHTTPNKKTKYRELTNDTLGLLIQKLEGEKWEDVYREKNPQHAYTVLSYIL